MDDDLEVSFRQMRLGQYCDKQWGHLWLTHKQWYWRRFWFGRFPWREEVVRCEYCGTFLLRAKAGDI